MNTSLPAFLPCVPSPNFAFLLQVLLQTLELSFSPTQREKTLFMGLQRFLNSDRVLDDHLLGCQAAHTALHGKTAQMTPTHLSISPFSDNINGSCQMARLYFTSAEPVLPAKVFA